MLCELCAFRKKMTALHIKHGAAFIGENVMKKTYSLFLSAETGAASKMNFTSPLVPSALPEKLS